MTTIEVFTRSDGKQDWRMVADNGEVTHGTVHEDGRRGRAERGIPGERRRRAAVRIIDTEFNKPLMDRLDQEIKKLRGSRKFRAALVKPSCSHRTPPGLVRRTFRYRDGRVVEVRAHAKVMVGLMEAMRDAPTLEVTATATSRYSGSYRSYAQQSELYEAYIGGWGHKAANPCSGYHRCGRAFDLVQPLSEREDEAMTKVRVDGKRFFNGASFGDPAHWSFGDLG